MNPFIKTLLAATAATWVSASVLAQDQDKTVHVYNWSDYIGSQTLARFTEETGIQVVYDVFDSNEVLEAKLLAGHSGYDVVVPSNPFLARQIKAGVFRKLDREQLDNWSSLDQDLLHSLASSDPGNQYGVPYMWGTVGIGYDLDKVTAILGENPPVDSWALVFNPQYMEKLQACGVSFLDSATEILPAALNYLGFAPDSVQPQELQEATVLLQKVRPFIRYFHSSKYISDLANGDVCVAVGYSGDIYQAQARAAEAGSSRHIGYSVPIQGAGMFFDMLAIPADARNVAEAHVLINYLMRPEVIAEITNEVRFPNANAQATPLVDEAIRTDPGIYPNAAMLEKLYTFPDLPARAQRRLTRSWMAIKSGR